MKAPSENVGMPVHLFLENPVQNRKEPWTEAQPNGSAPCNMMTNLFGRQQDIATATLGQSTCENNTDNSFYPTIHQEPCVGSTLPVQVSGYTVGLINQRKCNTYTEKSTTTTKLPLHQLPRSKPDWVQPVLDPMLKIFLRDYLIELCILFSVYSSELSFLDYYCIFCDMITLEGKRP